MYAPCDPGDQTTLFFRSFFMMTSFQEIIGYAQCRIAALRFNALAAPQLHITGRSP
jgi:hypothetical protein